MAINLKDRTLFTKDDSVLMVILLVVLATLLT
ncbi:hypothetical protein [Escherichia phage vB_EcoM_EP32a]|nr:hypothetical protein [Escherichia phage vB_EcoM_EP32a]